MAYRAEWEVLSGAQVERLRAAGRTVQVLGVDKVLRVGRVNLADGEPFARVTVWGPDELGAAFVGIELDDGAARPGTPMRPHSVLTEHLIDELGQPTRDALDQVLDLFRRKLLTG